MMHFTPEHGQVMATLPEFVKRPNPVHMKQVDEEFTVDTAEGVMHGNAGWSLIR
jgi:hypothetical protein